MEKVETSVKNTHRSKNLVVIFSLFCTTKIIGIELNIIVGIYNNGAFNLVSDEINTANIIIKKNIKVCLIFMSFNVEALKSIIKASTRKRPEVLVR